MPKDTNYDHLIKLLIVGDSGIGKTNILLRFCENNFLNSHLTTIGNKSLMKELTLGLRLLILIIKELDYKSGTQQASKDLRLSLRRTLEELWGFC